MNKKLLLFNILIAFIFAGVLLYNYSDKVSDFFNYSKTAISYYGSRGTEVTQIQTRLKKWGYYNGTIDGIYGYKTYTAVKYFQSKNGLTADGVAGSKTLAAMGISSTSSSSTYANNVDLLAHLIHGEARGEPYTGKVAVAAVVLNRIKDSRFPSTISGVIYQPGAFDAVSDGQINLEPTQSERKAATDAYNGWDPSKGAIYYFNPKTATSKWIWSRPIVTIIGNHYFAK